ncbi:23S rRNA (guanosine(2251)-2'-O)-methyltransferase RlmB [Pseudonocardiaceae bacterium YIM PH 21723]|nr:23S rRNA (guanosine(2251)-2'-O)-methyltransferase RlmB [Pseudonocardiaceae bacterium YIM PH 21723]
MAGNSQRRGAMRKAGTKKGAVVGSGGQRRKGLEGRGATPKAEDRPNHKAYRRKEFVAKKNDQQNRRRKSDSDNEYVAGRNPVVECLRAKVPATALYVAIGIDPDDRVTEAVRLAGDKGISVLEAPRAELDKLTNGAVHMGMALQVPPFTYIDNHELLRLAATSPSPGLLVALDGVTDPRNLGAVIRSAAAFGAHGVAVPERRAAGVTAVAWRTSAGTAAKLPIAKITNLTRSIKEWQDAGFFVIGLDADSTITSDQLDMATDPIVVVVGSEGRGISRLVRETCDATVSIPMAAGVESLNASVAAGVVLSEIARRRRTA